MNHCQNTNDVTEVQKEKLISSITYILSNPSSATGYYESILSLLNEMNVSLSSYLSMCINFLSHRSKDKDDLQLLSGYLFLMKNFSKLFTDIDESQLSKQVLNISKHLGYEKMDRNKVLMRLGEKGIKAYIMLSGNIDVLIKTAKKMKISQQNYIYYIGTLLRYKEYGLLHSTMNDNYPIFPIAIENDLTSDAFPLYQLSAKNASLHVEDKIKIYKASSILDMVNQNNTNKKKEKELNNVTSEDYISRLNVFKDVRESTRKYGTFSPDEIDSIEVNIYSYMRVASLTTGALFGEIALSDPAALRTATIITTSECHFGTLNKTSYNESLKQCKEKIYRSALSFIFSIKLFSDIKANTLGRKYFNNFCTRKLSKGDYLYVEGEKIESLFLLREGEYEISFKASLKDVSQLIKRYYSKLRNSSSKIQMIEDSERAVESEIKENANLGKIYNTKQIIRISCINAPDIVGINDLLNDEKVSYYTVQCKSVKGEVFELSTVFYNEMKMREDSITINEKSLLQKKYKIMIDRLNSIRNSKLGTYSHFMRYKFDLETEIDNDIKKTMENKRKIDAKKTVITARDVKLIKSPEQPQQAPSIPRWIAQRNELKDQTVFKRSEKKKMTIEVPHLVLKGKIGAYTTISEKLKENTERRQSSNPYSFSEETIKYLNTTQKNNTTYLPSFKTQNNCQTERPKKKNKRVCINDLAIDGLGPQNTIFLLDSSSSNKNELPVRSIRKRKATYISNTIKPFQPFNEIIRTDKRTKTVSYQNNLFNSEKGKYLQYTINKIKATKFNM